MNELSDNKSAINMGIKIGRLSYFWQEIESYEVYPLAIAAPGIPTDH